MFKPGQVLSFSYPSPNLDNVPWQWKPRRVLVKSVRDTLAVPLRAETLIAEPRRMRGRYLYECWDFDAGKVKSYYDVAMCGARRMHKRSAAKLLACIGNCFSTDLSGSTFCDRITEQPGGKGGPPTFSARRCKDVGGDALEGSAMRTQEIGPLELLDRRPPAVGYQLGLYNPASPNSAIRLVGRVYSADEQEEIRYTIWRFNRLSSRLANFTLCISAFPVEV